MEIERIKQDVERLDKKRIEIQRQLATLEGRKQQILSTLKGLSIDKYEDILPQLKEVKQKREEVSNKIIEEYEKLKEWWIV